MATSMWVSWRSAMGVKNRLGDTPAHAHSAVNDARSGSDPDSTRDIVLRLTPASAAACLIDRLPRCARTTWPSCEASRRSAAALSGLSGSLTAV